ncbi:TatD family hydrolase [Kaistella palustris]|uniref:TatD family hydrolase n=1 Tax=Kaistella palustris TaxID=493376 RepID=UPI00048951D8|nr:TatD family hydrolase [Kaistella palustris]
MVFFDFHHHTFPHKSGIYNLSFPETPAGQQFSAGIHPNEISDDLDEKFLWLKKMSALQNCVAIGECGLDGRIDTADEFQEEVFTRQISLASDLKKPLILHCVKRFSRLIPLCRTASVPVILHGFNKKETIGRDLLEAGFYLSFGKSLLYDVNLQRFLSESPPAQIFLETDSVDISIESIYHKAASLKNLSVRDLTEQIRQNLQTIKIPI